MGETGAGGGGGKEVVAMLVQKMRKEKCGGERSSETAMVHGLGEEEQKEEERARWLACGGQWQWERGEREGGGVGWADRGEGELG